MTTVYCAYCGAKLERRQGQISRNHTGRFYCSNLHRGLHEKAEGLAIGKAQQRGWRRLADVAE